MSEKFADIVSTTLNGAINNAVTSLSVTSATGFPTSGTFTIRIDNELFRVTGVSGTTFTVTRAAGSPATAAASHSDLATVNIVVSTESITQLMADIGVTVKGTVTLDFGSTYSSETSATVTASTIEATSDIRLRVSPVASSNHTADEALIASKTIALSVKTITAGASFVVDGVDPGLQWGQYTVAYDYVA